MNLETSPYLVSAYRKFRQQVANPRSVLYSSCGWDSSPAQVFDNITFVDAEKGNEGCIEAFKKAGFKAIKSDIRQYNPLEQHDLALIMNPGTPSEWITQHVQPKGFIIANNYHRSATQLAKRTEEYELYGTIHSTDKDAQISRNLDGLFIEVGSGQELREIDPERYKEEMDLMAHILRVPRDKAIFEKMRPEFCRRMGLPVSFPFRRNSGLYIFIKK